MSQHFVIQIQAVQNYHRLSEFFESIDKFPPSSPIDIFSVISVKFSSSGITKTL